MNLNVLLVDDDEVVLFMHDLMIIESGLSMKTIAFENAVPALDFLSQQTEEDARYLIFLDIHMPMMNGWDFLDNLQQFPLRDRVSVMMTTSSIDSADRERARIYPMVTEFIEKPLTKEIFARIKNQVSMKMDGAI